MKTLSLTLDYLRIEQLIDLIDEPNRSVCHTILKENRILFERSRGSTHNHQTWVGGYIDHVIDCMNYARHLYVFNTSFGRPLPFSLSDALLVLFLHDIEKPWRIKINLDGKVASRRGLKTKKEMMSFREEKLETYGISLTPEQHNGLKYVEGEYKDYSSKRRVKNELAAFCHNVDTWSARGWYDHPKESDDEWTGATRFRVTQ